MDADFKRQLAAPFTIVLRQRLNKVCIAYNFVSYQEPLIYCNKTFHADFSFSVSVFEIPFTERSSLFVVQWQNQLTLLLQTT